MQDFIDIIKEKFPNAKDYSSVRTVKFGANVFHSEDILYIASVYDAHKEEFGLKDYCFKRSGKEVRCLIFY